MPVLGLAIVALQICVVVHAFRSGRPYWWFFVIMAFPLVGSLIYYVVEVLPGSRQERSIQRLGSDLVKAINPDQELRRRAEELAICGSVLNKLLLARECLEQGQFDDAIHLYESAREGQYLQAPDLLLGLARAHFFNGAHEEARRILGELAAAHPTYYLQDVAILRARTAASLGDPQWALQELEAILDHSVGLEARYRYAEILWKQGAVERARAELERVIDHARRFKVSTTERAWAKLAQTTLSAL